MHEIFVNYRTNDAHDAAFAIQADMAHRFGADKVFFASHSLKHGESFGDELIREVAKARVLLAVIGPQWFKRDAAGHRLIDDENDWVRREIVTALNTGTRIIPVLVGRTLDRLPADLPPDIKELLNFNYRRFDHREAEANLSRIAAAVQELVPGLTDSTEQKPEPPATTGGTTSTNQSGGFIIGNQSGGTNFGGAVNTGGGTFIGTSHGNVHTGSGAQFNTSRSDKADDEK